MYQLVVEEYFRVVNISISSLGTHSHMTVYRIARPMTAVIVDKIRQHSCVCDENKIVFNWFRRKNLDSCIGGETSERCRTSRNTVEPWSINKKIEEKRKKIVINLCSESVGLCVDPDNGNCSRCIFKSIAKCEARHPLRCGRKGNSGA